MTDSRNLLKAAQMARALVSGVLRLSTDKSDLGELTGHVVRSVGTARSYQQCVFDFLRWQLGRGLGLNEPVLRSDIDSYLLHQSAVWRQKTLDQHRQALSLVFAVNATYVEAEVPTAVSGRAYTLVEMELIARHQQPHNALSSHLAFFGGLRAAEMHELRRADELAREPGRRWHADLFVGLPPGRRYSTTGKGGLARNVWLPKDLAELLEQTRREAPVLVTDRTIRRHAFYSIGGGHAFSESVSDASKRALGFSLGAHGFRHAYAQSRIATLVALGYDLLDAFEIVSNEMGHMRAEILAHYLPQRVT